MTDTEYKENIDTMEDTTSERMDDTSEEAAARQASEGVTEAPIDDEIATAVLLVMNRKGAVLPVTKLDNLKMDRQANAHEVLRMCADVQDQISAVRVVGELAQIFQHLQQGTLKQVADMLAKKIDDNLT
jgi:hypothetical protein